MSKFLDVYLNEHGRIPMFVVYRPVVRSEWVVRMHYSLPHHEASNLYETAPTLAEVRKNLPPGTYRLKNIPDDPFIEEVWI